jgi:hypothetical protein
MATPLDVPMVWGFGFRYLQKQGGREGGRWRERERESLAYEEQQLGGAFSVLLVLFYFCGWR